MFALLLQLAPIFVIAQISPELKAVKVGGCFDMTNSVFLHCAALEDECEQAPGIRFKTANELSKLGNYKCTTDTLPIGSCKSTGLCAMTKDSCEDPADFSPLDLSDGGCNAEGIVSNGKFVPTQYGACVHGTTGDVTCVLTPKQCSDKESWVSASIAETKKIGGCRCHDVLVGACNDSHGTDSNGPINHMLSTCAISDDDCNPLVQSFSTARNVKDHALLDCRLCPYHESLVGEPGELTDQTSTELPTALSTGAKQEFYGTNQGGLSGGEIAGILVGVIAGASAIIAIVLFSVRRNKKDKPVEEAETIEETVEQSSGEDKMC